MKKTIRIFQVCWNFKLKILKSKKKRLYSILDPFGKMNDLKKDILKSITLIYPKIENGSNSLVSFNNLIENHIYDETSEYKRKWYDHIDKMTGKLRRNIFDVTNTQFPAYVCAVELENRETENSIYLRSIFISCSLIGQYYSIMERVILKTKVDDKFYETFLLINTSPSHKYIDEHKIINAAFKSTFEEWEFVPASIWKITEENFLLPPSVIAEEPTLYSFLFGPIRSFLYSIGNDFYDGIDTTQKAK